MSPIMLAQLCNTGVLKRYNLESLECVTLGGSKPNEKLWNELKYALPKATLLQVFGTFIKLIFQFLHSYRKKIFDHYFIIFILKVSLK